MDRGRGQALLGFELDWAEMQQVTHVNFLRPRNGSSRLPRRWRLNSGVGVPHPWNRLAW